jgi:phosphatidyl-myo-inositol alpha-mannosyltransferase
MFSACPAPDGANYRTVQVLATRRWRTFGFAWRLRAIDFSGYDVLHAHGDDYWLWRRRAPAHVRTMHGSCFAEAVRIPGAREKVRMILLGLSEVLASAVVDRAVLVSPDTRRWLPWVSSVIPNGVEPHFWPDPAQRSTEPTILFVGTYGNRKRGWLLMDIFTHQIRPRIPDARLIMVCSDAPPATGVTVTGRIPGDALADLFRKAWVFCLPSSYEGFGIPYVEALVSGLPVVATTNPGARYVLSDGRAGVMCPDHELGWHLVRLLTDESLRTDLIARGIEHGRRFTLDGVLTEYLAIYQELRARRGA